VAAIPLEENCRTITDPYIEDRHNIASELEPIKERSNSQN